MTMDLEVNQYCFACGADNPIGLKLRFTQEQDGVKAVFIPRKEYQGYANLLHGGIISALMDEAMAQAIIAAGYKAVTIRMDLSFANPTIMDVELVVTGSLVSKKGRLIKTSAQIVQNNRVTAKANADFLTV
jgi:uncharacterized protein (TIGR00369 family)